MIPRAAFILFLCSAIPALADDAYMITAPNPSADQFGTINLSTGLFTSLGYTDVNGNALDPVALEGLGEVGNTLYGGDVAGNLYSVNTTDGALTQINVGAGAIDFVDFGSTLTTLYALDSVGDLYSVNPTTGLATLVGSTTVGAGGTSSLSTGSSTLYLNLFNSGAYNLYTLNTTGGAATLVGPTNGIGALVSDSGTLYGGQNTFEDYGLETINTSNGNVTAGAGLTGTTSDFGGLAPTITATTPEPTSVILLSTMLLAVAFVVRKRIVQGL
jgi:hypothetical protein